MTNINICKTIYFLNINLLKRKNPPKNVQSNVDFLSGRDVTLIIAQALSLH